MKLALAGVVALSVLFTATARAQTEEQSFNYLSITVAAAAGSARVTCAECDGARAWAPSGFVRIGQLVAPGLTLSGEVDVWQKSEDWVVVADAVEAKGTSRFTIGTLNAVAQWYPIPAGGFFADAGLGIGRYHVSSKSRDLGGSAAYSNAFGYQYGAGYDVPLSEHIAITPSVKIFGFFGASLQEVGGKVGGNVAQVALGLTWH